jgi:glycosyltransferase involved in cell wall biosynthesis
MLRNTIPSPLKPSVSIVVCTRNRCASLETMLSRLPIDELRKYDCELILVDNGSTDGTPEVIDEFAAGYGERAMRVIAREPGLSNARNAGVASARGDIVCFMDDDCYLHQGYFETVFREFSNNETSFIGGQIWLHDPNAARIGVNYNNRRRVYAAKAYVRPGDFHGANLAFRRDVLNAIGPFDPKLGAGAAFRCEDIEICGRATAMGYRGIHVPDLIVYHDHGRTKGSESSQQIERLNEEASGAYHAVLVKRGEMRYMLFFLYTLIRRRRLSRAYYQICGFIGYLAG